jgi:membrane fusion protein, multidrug efflux system
MNTRKIVVSVILSVLIVVSGKLLQNYLTSKKTEPFQRPQTEQKQFVQAKTVNYKDLPAIVIAYGRVISGQNINLVSEVQGKIVGSSVPLRNGQSFKKGDLLVKIDDTEFQLSIKAKKSTYLNRVASILADFKLDFPESFEKWNTYFGQIDIDKPLPDLPSFSNNTEKTYIASAGILTDFYMIKTDEERLNRYKIYAPFNGSFIMVNAEAGTVLNPGSPIAQIVSNSAQELSTPITSEDGRNIQIGSKVKIYNTNGEGYWNGVINRISDVVNPQTQSRTAFIQIFPNPKFLLHDGLYLRAEIEGKTYKNVMEVPRKSVYNSNTVYLIRNSELEAQDANILFSNENNYFINGLSVGDTLLTESLLNARNGLKVQTLQ